MNFENHIDSFQRELELKNYSKNTVKNYLSVLNLFLHHFEKSMHPKNINENQIKEYLKNLSSVSLLKQNIGCLKLFYKFVVRQPLKFKFIQYPRKEHRLPDILSPEEVMMLINACDNLKHKAIVMLLFSTGIRISELLDIKLCDIDSKEMVILIHGKGAKDRYVPLSENVLKMLRLYYQKEKPKNYLFNGQCADQYTASSVRQVLRQLADKVKLQKDVYPHLLRHSSFSEMLSMGNDLREIQVIAGHKSISTTTMYTHLNKNFISKIATPL
jgi:site-specific recombinase XerD